MLISYHVCGRTHEVKTASFGFVIAVAALFGGALPFRPVSAQSAVPRNRTNSARPPIIGLAHVGLFVSDLARAEDFYGHTLGYQRFSLNKPDGSLFLHYYKINDHQYLEIYPGLQGDNDRLSHVAFETTDIRKLRDYLAAKGVKVPATLQPGADKNISFTIDDPEGRHIEFVQYLPGSLHRAKWGTLLPSTRVSDHMIHAGFVVHDRAAEDHLYKDILGFKVMWYGGKTDSEINWVDMRVPDGSDWLEYMLRADNPSVKARGVMNHIALGVKSIQPAYHTILDRGYKPPEPPKIGRDGKWQLNLYDPDLTRVEMMEFTSAREPCCSPMLSR